MHWSLFGRVAPPLLSFVRPSQERALAAGRGGQRTGFYKKPPRLSAGTPWLLVFNRYSRNPWPYPRPNPWLPRRRPSSSAGALRPGRGHTATFVRSCSGLRARRQVNRPQEPFTPDCTKQIPHPWFRFFSCHHDSQHFLGMKTSSDSDLDFSPYFLRTPPIQSCVNRTFSHSHNLFIQQLDLRPYLVTFFQQWVFCLLNRIWVWFFESLPLVPFFGGPYFSPFELGTNFLALWGGENFTTWPPPWLLFF